jgi:hypothetical protein
MAIDSEVVVMHVPNTDGNVGSGAASSEVKNQQLNEALASGTVDSILMKDSYVSTLNSHVVVRKDLSNYASFTAIDAAIAAASLNFTWYDSPKKLQIKANPNYNGIPAAPTNAQLGIAEMAVDNSDASIYTRRYHKFNSDGSLGAAIPGGKVSRINAGYVNGISIDSSNFLSKDDIQNYVVNKINEAFSYNSSINSLTVKKVSV